MTKNLTYREALGEGLRYAFQNDPRVFMMGEDIGKYGGPYGAVSYTHLDVYKRQVVGRPDEVRGEAAVLMI